MTTKLEEPQEVTGEFVWGDENGSMFWYPDFQCFEYSFSNEGMVQLLELRYEMVLPVRGSWHQLLPFHREAVELVREDEGLRGALLLSAVVSSPQWAETIQNNLGLIVRLPSLGRLFSTMNR